MFRKLFQKISTIRVLYSILIVFLLITIVNIFYHLIAGQYETVTDNIQQDSQLNLLANSNSAVIDKLSKIDLNTLTPIESMNLLYELKNMLN